VGLGIAAAGVVSVGSWAGLLPYVGSALFLCGTSGSLVRTAGIGSILRLLAGAPERRARLTEEARAVQHRMSEVAEPICTGRQVPFVIDEACYVAAADWPDDVTDAFRWYLLCRVIEVAKQRAARLDPPRAVLTAAQLQAVIGSLHHTSRIPTAVIAGILDVDVSTVRACLTAPGPTPAS
jgi:hypothetical protein